MKRTILILVMLCGGIIETGCGGGKGGAMSNFPAPEQPQALSNLAADFDAAASGQHIQQVWVNGYGDHTYIEYYTLTPAERLCNVLDEQQIMQHITKDNPRTYWGVGVPAEAWIVLSKRADGSWRFPGGSWSWQTPTVNTTLRAVYDSTPGDSYVMSVPTIQAGQTIVKQGKQHWLHKNSIDTFGCYGPTDAGVFVDAQQTITFTFTVENINTPMYGGPALHLEQNEANPKAYRENWWYAPGIGLVQIKPITSTDPNLIIKRVQ